MRIFIERLNFLNEDPQKTNTNKTPKFYKQRIFPKFTYVAICPNFFFFLTSSFQKNTCKQIFNKLALIFLCECPECEFVEIL